MPTYYTKNKVKSQLVLNIFKQLTILALLVALFYIIAFVIILFTLTECDNELDVATLSKQFQRDNTHTCLFALS